MNPGQHPKPTHLENTPPPARKEAQQPNLPFSPSPFPAFFRLQNLPSCAHAQRRSRGGATGRGGGVTEAHSGGGTKGDEGGEGGDGGDVGEDDGGDAGTKGDGDGERRGDGDGGGGGPSSSVVATGRRQTQLTTRLSPHLKMTFCIFWLGVGGRCGEGAGEGSGEGPSGRGWGRQFTTRRSPHLKMTFCIFWSGGEAWSARARRASGMLARRLWSSTSSSPFTGGELSCLAGRGGPIDGCLLVGGDELSCGVEDRLLAAGQNRQCR